MKPHLPPTLRHFFQRATLALALLLLAPPTPAQTPEFVEGIHYQILPQAQPTQSGKKIEVVEMFWYGCPHCYRLEPFIARWLENKPANAHFIAIPAVLSPRWELHARMFYTLQALGLEQKLHAQVFHALHETRLPLKNMSQFADWASRHGADRAAVLAASKSFAVQNKLNFAALVSRKYGITGVPAIIVDGRYRTSVSLAGGHTELFQVINHLIALAAKKRA